MNYLNGLLENSVKQNVLYFLAIGGACYIAKSAYDMVLDFVKESRETKEIKEIIEKELSKLNPDIINNSKFDVCVSLYYKVIYTVYKKDFAKFNKKRRDIFNLDDIDKYINFVEDYLKNLKLIEEKVFKIIYEELNIEVDGSEVESFKPESIDLHGIKGKYYSEVEVELPESLDYQKLNEIIMVIFDKTKFYLIKLREHLNYKDDYVDDKLQLLGEYMAFDFIYQKYNYEREVIEKAMSYHNLNIVEK